LYLLVIAFHLLGQVEADFSPDYYSSQGAGDKMNIDQSTNHTTHGKIVQAKNPNRTPKQNKIMEYFASIQPPDEGINIHEIARQCHLDVKEVM
jgi:hypothetical protein